jgi:hypothetical protein
MLAHQKLLYYGELKIQVGVKMSKFVNQASIREYFPPNIPIPPRLSQFLDWAESISLTGDIWIPEFFGESFDLYASTFDGYNVEVGFAQNFGIFAHLGDGSTLAYWVYEGCDRDHLPIVLQGSEGDLGVVAASIEDLTARIIDNQFFGVWVEILGDLLCDGVWVKKLETWAEETWDLTRDRRNLITALDPTIGHPVLEEWLNIKFQDILNAQ